MTFGSNHLILIEIAFVAIAVLIAMFYPRCGDRWFRACENAAGRLANRTTVCVLIVGITAFLLRSLPLPARAPEVHDEFSYLLAADTFSSGRLTNPTHPMWRHFESIHVIQRPTYASMYPAAQGLVLALGVGLGGNAWLGVSLSVALACASLCWMLQGWMPPGWALLGAVLALMRLSVFNYWANTYWGGMVAVIGGALVLGAVPRLRRKLRVQDAVWLGLGLVILANSRPYEGLMFSLPVAAALAIWAFGRNRPDSGLILRRVVAPLLLVLVTAGVLMAYYFKSVTGDPLRMPYQVNQSTYSLTNPFFWQSLRQPPAYRHAVMRDYYQRWELASVTRLSSFSDRVKEVAAKMRDLWAFYLGPALTVPLLMLPWAYKDRSIWLPLLACITMLLAVAPVYWLTFPHYAAPMTAAVFVVLMQCARHLRSVEYRSRPAGRFLARTVPLICLATLLVRGSVPAFAKLASDSHSWCCVGPGNLDRANLEEQLASSGESHLMIVRYSQSHKVQNEWVYNKANIDSAKVVWAREMARDDNRRLLTYFKQRRAWLVEPDLVPPRLSPYPTNLLLNSDTQKRKL